MNVFRSYISFLLFQQEIKHVHRYIRTPATEEFLNVLGKTCKKREDKIPQNSILWRAQLGNDFKKVEIKDKNDIVVDYYEEAYPFSKERMKPDKNHCSEGRANPKGIPYLYLATKKETAMAEVRPWIGANISLAQFKILEDITIINFSLDEVKRTLIYLKEPKPDKREDIVWADINDAYSKPVDRINNIIEYVPTQIISEFIRKQGYAGIAYKSLLGNGAWFKLTDQSQEELKKNVPENIVDLLNNLKNQEYKVEGQFVEALKNIIGEENTETYKSVILYHAGNGHNVVLFDIDIAKQINCFLYHTNNISFNFEKIIAPFSSYSLKEKE